MVDIRIRNRDGEIVNATGEQLRLIARYSGQPDPDGWVELLALHSGLMVEFRAGEDLLSLPVYVKDEGLSCNLPDCACGHDLYSAGELPIPGRRVTLREIAEAIINHRKEHAK